MTPRRSRPWSRRRLRRAVLDEHKQTVYRMRTLPAVRYLPAPVPPSGSTATPHAAQKSLCKKSSGALALSAQPSGSPDRERTPPRSSRSVRHSHALSCPSQGTAAAGAVACTHHCPPCPPRSLWPWALHQPRPDLGGDSVEILVEELPFRGRCMVLASRLTHTLREDSTVRAEKRDGGGGGGRRQRPRRLGWGGVGSVAGERSVHGGNAASCQHCERLHRGQCQQHRESTARAWAAPAAVSTAARHDKTHGSKQLPAGARTSPLSHRWP